MQWPLSKNLYRLYKNIWKRCKNYTNKNCICYIQLEPFRLYFFHNQTTYHCNNPNSNYYYFRILAHLITPPLFVFCSFWVDFLVSTCYNSIRKRGLFCENHTIMANNYLIYHSVNFYFFVIPTWTYTSNKKQ